MTASACPPYLDIQFAYPYAKIFLLLHNPMTATHDQIAAYGNLLDQEHRMWLGVLAYQSNQAAPLICPPAAFWIAGFDAAKHIYDAGPGFDAAAYLSSVGVTYAQFLAGLSFYAYDELYEAMPLQSDMGLLLDLLYFATHL